MPCGILRITRADSRQLDSDRCELPAGNRPRDQSCQNQARHIEMADVALLPTAHVVLFILLYDVLISFA